MNKCTCYQERTITRKPTDFELGFEFAKSGKFKDTITETIGYCYGTREQERCTCKGNKARCDFYPDVRKET